MMTKFKSDEFVLKLVYQGSLVDKSGIEYGNERSNDIVTKIHLAEMSGYILSLLYCFDIY